jgi:hypothetical protein
MVRGVVVAGVELPLPHDVAGEVGAPVGPCCGRPRASAEVERSARSSPAVSQKPERMRQMKRSKARPGSSAGCPARRRSGHRRRAPGCAGPGAPRPARGSVRAPAGTWRGRAPPRLPRAGGRGAGCADRPHSEATGSRSAATPPHRPTSSARSRPPSPRRARPALPRVMCALASASAPMPVRGDCPPK